MAGRAGLVMILALDIATVTGWAVALPGCRRVSGVVNLRANRSADERYILPAMTAMLDTVERKFGRPDLIATEDVKFHHGFLAARRHWALRGTLEAWTVTGGRFVPIELLGIAAVKQFATGAGNADKAAMMRAGRARGWKIQDDNEADALWILDLAISNRKTKGK